jgi:hypothetical protein
MPRGALRRITIGASIRNWSGEKLANIGIDLRTVVEIAVDIAFPATIFQIA